MRKRGKKKTTAGSGGGGSSGALVVEKNQSRNAFSSGDVFSQEYKLLYGISDVHPDGIFSVWGFKVRPLKNLYFRK